MSDPQRSLFDTDELEVGRQRIAELREVLAGDRPAAPSADAQRAVREQAIDQVEEHNQDWIHATALPFLRRYLEHHATVFVEDLWAAGLPRPSEPKALGAAVRIAAQRGWMRKTGETRTSAQNANEKPIWESLVAPQGDTDD